MEYRFTFDETSNTYIERCRTNAICLSWLASVCSPLRPSSSSIFVGWQTASSQALRLRASHKSHFNFSFIKPIVQSARASVVVRTSYRLDVGFYCSHFTKQFQRDTQKIIPSSLYFKQLQLKRSCDKSYTFKQETKK